METFFSSSLIITVNFYSTQRLLNKNAIAFELSSTNGKSPRSFRGKITKLDNMWSLIKKEKKIYIVMEKKYTFLCEDKSGWNLSKWISDTSN